MFIRLSRILLKTRSDPKGGWNSIPHSFWARHVRLEHLAIARKRGHGKSRISGVKVAQGTAVLCKVSKTNGRAVIKM